MIDHEKLAILFTVAAFLLFAISIYMAHILDRLRDIEKRLGKLEPKDQ